MSFGANGVVTAAALSDTVLTSAGVQPDGRILVGGTSYVSRLTRDGQPDSTFANGGSLSFTNSLLAAVSDGRFYIVTRTGSQTIIVARYTSDGRPDFSFGGTGIMNVNLGVSPFAPDSARALSDGSLVLGGSTNRLLKMSPNGVVTNLSANVSGRVCDVVELPDGDLLVAHAAYWSGGRTRPAVTRLNADGTLDTSFTRFVAADEAAAAGYSAEIVRQSNGRILMACIWAFDTAIIAIDPTGHLDTGWGNDGMLRFDFGASNERAEEMLVHADDSLTLAISVILNANAGGTTYSNVADVMLVHLNAEGERDALFGVNGATRYNSGTSDSAEALAQQPDGKLILVSTPFLHQGGEVTRFSAPVAASPISVTADGQLQVVGTAGADVITIAEAGTKYMVNLNGVEAQISRSIVFSSLIAAGGGNDQITLNVQSDLPVTVNGGSGDDTLHALYAQPSGVNLLSPQSGEGALTFGSVTQPVNHMSVESIDMGAATPFLTSASLEMETRLALTLTFNADIGASLSASDLVLRDLGSAAIWPIRDEELTLSQRGAGRTVASIALPWMLSSAHWRLDIAAGAIASAAGVVGDFEHRVKFDYSPGDTNGNGLTDFADVYVVVQHYGRSASVRSEGDVNYDGRVGFEDLLAVAQNFNLPLPMFSMIAPSRSRRATIADVLV